jgi:hypothetical protein
MAVKSTSTPRLLACLLVLAILNGWSPLFAGAAGNAPGAFDIGTPTLTELWVSVNGNDSNSGLASDAPLKTLTAAFAKIPATTHHHRLPHQPAGRDLPLRTRRNG